MAFAVSIAELTMFAMQAQEKPRARQGLPRRHAAYFVSAFAINRIAHFVEGPRQVPNDRGQVMNLDFGFFNWAWSSFILKGCCSRSS